MTGLDKWLLAQRKLTGAKYVELRHIGVTDEASPVQRWLVDDGGAGSLASEIWTSAQQWADGIGSGPQRFAVAVLDVKDKPLAQYLMRAATDAVGGLSYDSEPATLAGVTKQLMRHTEAIMRGSAAAHAQLIEHLLREHARLSTRCEALEGRHLELLELSEDLLSQRSTRELTRERALMQERRKDDLLRKMGTLLPVVMAKLSGSSLPAQLDPAVAELAKSLDAEQLDKLTAVLRPEQVIALTTVLERSAALAKPNGTRKVLEPETGRG